MLMTFSLSCQQNGEKESKPLQLSENKTHKLTKSKVELLKDLSIPKKWVKITMVDSVWNYLIPCKEESDLPSIELTKIEGEEALMFEWGTAGQWHEILDITEQKDSIVFKTVVPYDRDYPVYFVFKYLDKNRKIASWTVDNEYFSYFIPISDTSNYIRVAQLCE
jgi:hypothetical protein